MKKTEAVRAFFDAYTQHKVDEMTALCSQSGTCRYVPYEEKGIGSLHEVAAGMWQANIDAFPDFSARVVSMIEGDNRTIVCETLNGGTQGKDAFGVKNKGRKQYTPHLFIFEFDTEGLINKVTAFWDNDTIYAQLGHTEHHD